MNARVSYSFQRFSYGVRYGACPARSRGNPKISLWLSVDPLAEKYPGMSPYNYTAENPINLVDPDGKIFLKWKDYQIAHKFKAILTRKLDFFTRRAEKLYAQYKALKAKGKSRRAIRKFLQFQEAVDGIVEMNSAITELEIIEKAKTVFTFQKTAGNKGNTKYAPSLRAVVITYNGEGLLGHELKHAYQGLTGKLNIYSGTSYDKQDEIEAYRRQYYVDRSSLPISASSANEINLNYIDNIIDKNGEYIYKKLPSIQILTPGGIHEPNIIKLELPAFKIEPLKVDIKKIRP